jgi:hydrogenase maturation factor
LFTVPQNEKDEIVSELKKAGILNASHIGNCLEKGEGKIFVKK